jgi:hypothetical protein
MKQLNISLLLVMFVTGSMVKAKAQASFQLSTDAAAPGSTIVLKYNIAGKYDPADISVFFEREEALFVRCRQGQYP